MSTTIQNKLEDLEKSVTFLGDQNISLLKALDKSERNSQQMELRIQSLGNV